MRTGHGRVAGAMQRREGRVNRPTGDALRREIIETNAMFGTDYDPDGDDPAQGWTSDTAEEIRVNEQEQPTPYWERRFTLSADTAPEGRPLSVRELHVLALLAEGRARKEIAVLLRISAHTVRFYQRHLLLKLGARNSTHAVAIALRRGLIDAGGGSDGD